MSEPSMDREMEVRLRALYQVELERAASDLRAAPMARRTRVGSRSGVLAAAFSSVAIAAVLLAALALRPGLGTNPGAGALATGTTPTSPTTAVTTAGSTPSATEPGQGGIPATVDGQPVLTGTAIADAISKSTDDTPFLIGGWFPAGGYYGPYCAALAPGPASCTPYLLHLSEGSEDSVFVYPTTAATDILSYMATQPVVMRVHTHDVRCTDLPNLDGCSNRLVLEEIVWLGPKS
jgi:hypothetical protein